MYETKALPAAPFVTIGLMMTLVGWPVLGAAWYFGIGALAGRAGPSEPLAFLGWVLVLGGAAVLGVGVHRLVQHADRAAGVRFTRDPRVLNRSTRWTTAQAADVLPPEAAPKE